MSIFRGIRQKLRGGADAGRGDQPYPAFRPVTKIPGMPMESRRNTSPTPSAPLSKIPGTPDATPLTMPNASSKPLYDMATKTDVPKIPTGGNIGNMKYRSAVQSYAKAHGEANQ